MKREDRTARTRAAALVADVARVAATDGPPPRGLPFFGLDHRSGTRLGLLDDLATRGIFRKYEHVLDLGAGLGASTRYMAARLGCTATATAASSGEAVAARMLTARARLDWQVLHVAASAERLPFARAAFTHVWIVESLARLGRVTEVLAEAYRVLRPGGHFGIQDLVPDAADEASADAAGSVPQDELAAAGFVELVWRDVTADAREERSHAQAAWAQLVGRLGAEHPIVRERERVTRALDAGRLRVVQLTARRP